MADDLSALTAKIQGILGDDGTRFSTSVCTAAVREALKAYNMYAPSHARAVLPVVPGQFEYMLEDTDFADLLKINSVHKAESMAPILP